jgi:transcriptional regulator with XRE-family HTH domain
MADRATVIGYRIASRRKERKLTQVGLAAAVGVTQAYIAKIEAGGALPTPDLLDHIAAALGTTAGPLTSDMPMVESERDTKCRELVNAAISNVFAQAGLMIAMGCLPSCKPPNKGFAINLVAGYATEYDIPGDKLAPILAFIKSGE